MVGVRVLDRESVNVNLARTGSCYRGDDPEWAARHPRRAGHHAASPAHESVMKNLVQRFIEAESATATAKYGLIAAAISAAIVTAALGIATKLAATSGDARALP
jgi:Flp pilus assembly pilin Flp